MRSPSGPQHRHKRKHRSHGQEEPGPEHHSPHASRPRIHPRPSAEPAPQRSHGAKSDSYIRSWLSETQRMRAQEPIPELGVPTPLFPRPTKVQEERSKARRRSRDGLNPESWCFSDRQGLAWIPIRKRARHKTREDRYDYKRADGNRKLASHRKPTRDPARKGDVSKAAREELVK